MRSGELQNNPEDAEKFANSIRGRFIISQALWIAAKSIDGPDSDRSHEEMEPSNAADMLYLMENLWPIYGAVQSAEQQAANEFVLRRAKKISD